MGVIGGANIRALEAQAELKFGCKAGLLTVEWAGHRRRVRESMEGSVKGDN